MTTSAEHNGRPPVRLREHGRLTPPLAGDVLVAVSVGPSGEAIALWMSDADQRESLTPLVDVRSRGRRPVSARVVVQTANGGSITHIDGLDLAFCQIQPLPDGQILAVARRGGLAMIFNADGALVRQSSVGDGTNHVLSTPSGHVWIGYFDEGIYGHDSVAHHGIVRFSADLEPDWLYPFDAEVGQVHDCYSLNVDAETAWSCFYSGFPVVRILAGKLTAWRTDLRGAAAVIVGAENCAVITGTQRLLAAIGHLGDGQFEPIGQRMLAVPGALDRSGRLRTVSRGPDLHVFAGTTWYRAGLEDMI